jgi:hypothetical protein
MKPKQLLTNTAAALLLSVGLTATTFAAERGVIVYENSNCIIIETSRGYTLAEWYGGTAWEGHTVVGDLESYGFTDLFDLNNDGELRVWIDDYWMSEDDAAEWVYENGCD